MEPEITNNWIDRYNEDELNDDEKAIFELSMASSPTLRSEVHIDACLNRFLMDFELQDLMKKIRSASKRNKGGSWLMDILLIVASILCISMILGVFYLLQSNAETAQHPFSGAPEQAGQELYSAARILKGTLPVQNDQMHHSTENPSAPLAEFEVLIGSGTRSNKVTLISPNVYVTIPAGNNLLFAWNEHQKAEPRSLVILNNQGITVAEVLLPHATFYNLSTKGYDAGLYYWKIMGEGKMVLMGKFTLTGKR